MALDPSQVIVVPVDLVALWVGVIDAGEAAPHFAGATAVYTNPATEDKPAFLGANVTQSFDDSPAQELEQGIHLHWALPDALTRATVPKVPKGQGALDF